MGTRRTEGGPACVQPAGHWAEFDGTKDVLLLRTTLELRPNTFSATAIRIRPRMIHRGRAAHPGAKPTKIVNPALADHDVQHGLQVRGHPVGS